MKKILSKDLKQIKFTNLIKKLRKEEVIFFPTTENLRKLIAKDAMIKATFVYSDDDVNKITKKLKREDTNVCIVVTKDKSFLGEIGNEDLIKLFLHQVRHDSLTKTLNTGYRREYFYKTAKELINKHNSTVKLDTPINDVIELVYNEGFEYIPVLDEDEKVLGVVTPSSILDLLQDY